MIQLTDATTPKPLSASIVSPQIGSVPLMQPAADPLLCHHLRRELLVVGRPPSLTNATLPFPLQPPASHMSRSRHLCRAHFPYHTKNFSLETYIDLDRVKIVHFSQVSPINYLKNIYLNGVLTK